MVSCNRCFSDKEHEEFYANDRTCKECRKRLVRENRKLRADYYKEYDAWRFQNDPKVRERHRRYQRTDRGKASLEKARRKYYEENKEAVYKSRREWLEKNPHKRLAHIMVNNAVRDGRILKEDKCVECGKSDSVLHGHHEDYGKPLEVIWLCPTCHASKHPRRTDE